MADRALHGWVGRVPRPALWWVLLAAPAVLAFTGWRLRRRGCAATLAALGAPAVGTPLPAAAVARARDLARTLALVCRFGPWAPRCLLRSLALGWFLARAGIPFDLRIGVGGNSVAATRDGDFQAHAWVEVDGIVINDRPDIAERCRPFPLRTPPA